MQSTQVGAASRQSLCALVIGIASCLLSASIGAVDMADEYAKQIKSAEAVGTMGPDIFGDRTNFYTGTTEFSVTDVSLPGNFAIPVRIGRRIAVGDVLIDPVARPFGDWDLDIPYLQGVFSNAGWQTQASYPDQRCSVNGPIAVPPVASAQGINFTGDEYWSGNTLYVPGQGSQEMLNTLVANTKPTDGPTYYWVTNNQWHFSCIGALGTSQTFLAIDPSGTRYQFDKIASRQTLPVSKPAAGPSLMSGGSTSSSTTSTSSPSSIGGPTPQVAQTPTLPRKEVRIFPSLVTDRFGNWVKYTYAAGNWKLLEILSSDNRKITLTYNAGGRIATVYDGTRTWTYTYSGGYLTTVTLPDASQWTYNFANMTQMNPQAMDEPITCEGLGQLYPLPSTFTATHPSGLQASFTFDGQRHGRSYVTRDCVYSSYPTTGYARYAPWYDVIALKSKALSGPGMPTATWTYTYGAPNASYADECAGGCPTTKTVEVAAPAGEYIRYTFGNKFFDNEGKLLSVERGSGPGAILSTQTSTYLINAPNQLYLAQVGVSPYLKGDRSGEKLNPTIATSTLQQGATFTWQVGNTSGVYAFNSYANPTKITRSSSGLSGPQPGYSRTELTTYKNDATTKAQWVLGLVETVTCSGGTDCTPAKEMSRTDYDATSLLPWKTYSFGILQQTLTYDLTTVLAKGALSTITDGRGNVATVSSWRRGIPQTIVYPSLGPGNTPQEGAVVDNIGRITSATDEIAAKTCYGYDAMGRLNLVTYPSEAATGTCNTTSWASTARSFVKVVTTEYGIAAGHWKQTLQTGNGKTTTFYDAQWRPVLVLTEDTGNALSKSFVVTRYDAAGRAVFASYPVGSLTSVNDVLKGVTTSYDTLGRVTQVQQDAEAAQPLLTTTTAYLSGFRTQVTNPRSKTTITSYQAYDTPSTDSPVQILHPAAVTTTIVRQPSLAKPLSVQRGGTYGGGTLSSVRSYVYDSNERPCKTLNPESNSALVDYDGAGNIAWSVDGVALPSLICDRGSVAEADRITRTYDALNRVTAVNPPGVTADVDTAYYADGAVKTLTARNPGGFDVQTNYTYNNRRLLTGETSSNGATFFALGYGYNANAHLSTLTYPDGQVVGYAPDALGRTTQVAVAGGQVYANTIGYYPTGAISGFAYGNQIVHSMTPNVRQLPARSFDTYNGTTFLDDSYAYDANGNVDFVTDALPVSATSHTRDMGYDDLDRLIVADSPDAVWGHATYSYDPIDNLRTVTIATSGGTVTRSHFYNYTPDNRLNSISGPTGHGAYGFTYDSRGNTTFKNVGTTNCLAYPVLQCVGKVPQTYVFDVANRQSEVTGVQTYRYDGLGRRVQTTDANGMTTFWMYSQSGQVIYSSEARRSQNISYLYLGNTQVATRTVAWGTGLVTVRYQHTDALGTPVVETDAARNITDRNTYSPWGEAWGTTVVDGTGYTGHVMDQGTGLTYMQQRYYDPQIGKFLSVDPVQTDPNTGFNFNAYWYANNNPYLFTDPDGRTSCLKEEGCKPDVPPTVQRMRDTSDCGQTCGEQGTTEVIHGKEIVNTPVQSKSGTTVTKWVDGALTTRPIAGGALKMIYHAGKFFGRMSRMVDFELLETTQRQDEYTLYNVFETDTVTIVTLSDKPYGSTFSGPFPIGEQRAVGTVWLPASGIYRDVHVEFRGNICFADCGAMRELMK